MAQFFSRVAGRHYLSSTIAAATATTLLATSISPKNDSVEDDVRTVGSVDGSRHRVEPSRRHLHLNSPQTSSSLFAYPRKSIVLCEAQHPSLHPNVTYKPSDPAEPGANPVGGIDVTTSDGRKVHVESGMWGEEQEGLVSHHNIDVRINCITSFRHSHDPRDSDLLLFEYVSTMGCFPGDNYGDPLLSIHCGRIIGMADNFHPSHLWQKRELKME